MKTRSTIATIAKRLGMKFIVSSTGLSTETTFRAWRIE